MNELMIILMTISFCTNAQCGYQTTIPIVVHNNTYDKSDTKTICQVAFNKWAVGHVGAHAEKIIKCNTTMDLVLMDSNVLADIKELQIQPYNINIMDNIFTDP